MTVVDRNGKPKISLLHKLLYQVLAFIDRHFQFNNVPTLLGLLYLGLRRLLMNEDNLIPVGPPKQPELREDSHAFPYRDEDGEYTDPFMPKAGAQFSFFGRLMPAQPQGEYKEESKAPTGFFSKVGDMKERLKDTVAAGLHLGGPKYSLLDPHPSLVAEKLLVRKSTDAKDIINAGDQFNMLAASWIQFNIHDWIDHEEKEDKLQEISAPAGVKCPLGNFKFYATKETPTNQMYPTTGHRNIRTAWWDGSVVYGQSEERAKTVRTHKDGKVRLNDKGLLEYEANGVQVVGDVKNPFLGVTLLQLLFMKEHNRVCDILKAAHPDWDDDKLYHTARLVIAALIAKIHTIDWTVELLKTPLGKASLNTNWYGLFGKAFKKKHGHLGNAALSGFPGSKAANNHGVPYALTEEFTSVYRLHPLLVEEIDIYDASSPVDPATHLPSKKALTASMQDMILGQGDKILDQYGEASVWVSYGATSCGLMRLHNYPVFLRKLIPTNTDGTPRMEHPIDLAALEIYRDRERGVPRYNNFRRGLHLNPISKWSDLTVNKQYQKELQEVYGDDVEKLDLMVGLFAEDLIPGWAITETSFFVFLSMASRRLDADRFFTSEYNEETYSKEGLEVVETTESMKDLLMRHFPDVVIKYLKVDSVFNKWNGNAKAFPDHATWELFLMTGPKKPVA